MKPETKHISILIIFGIFFVTMVKCLPMLYFTIGKSAFNSKQYAKANTYFLFAKNLNPTNHDYRYQYALSLSKLTPTMNIQKEVFALSEDKNKDRAVIVAQQIVAGWAAKIFENYGSNYIDRVAYDNNVVRWNPDTFPLQVAIEYPQGDSIPEYYKNEISRAFLLWESSTGFLKFELSDNLKNADIIVKFLPLPENNCDTSGCKYVVAYTEPLIRNHKLKNMTITLYDKDAFGNYFSDKELYNTILHEIGHALGIMGHSFSTEDLMYMASSAETQQSIYAKYRSSFQYLSAKDLNTIRLLYNITPTVTNTPLSKLKTEGLIYSPIILGSEETVSKKKIKEAQEYIKIAPNMPNGYIDLAAAYGTLGDVKKAGECLQKAFNLAQTPNDKYIVYYNFAVIYLNNNLPKEALPYAYEAQKIQNSDEVMDLISNIQHAISTKRAPFKDFIKKN